MAAFQDAIERKAKVVVVTTGGSLLQIGPEGGCASPFQIDYVGEPRTALGYSFLVPLAMVQSLELTSNSDQALLEASEVLISLSHHLEPVMPTHDNPAKELATTLHGKLIVIYGGGMLSGVARRWKTQFNENAKAWAFVELLPEAGTQRHRRASLAQAYGEEGMRRAAQHPWPEPPHQAEVPGH